MTKPLPDCIDCRCPTLRCPKCGGPPDNGHDRELPPNPYLCTKCVANVEEP
jgi:hypothetical protein